MKSNKTYKLVVTAMLIALATILNQFAVIQLPVGGGVTVFSQVPIITAGVMFGPLWGLFSGFVFSLLQLLFGLANFSYVKGAVSFIVLALFDYIFPYTILGLGDMFKEKLKNRNIELVLGTIIVCLIRFLCHFISGATVWAEWSGGQSVRAILIYSFTYNGSYMLPETIITVIGILALNKFLFPRLDKNGMIK
ncbi:MAG: energy-coupled thiamine transporter ThiT [Oscillospiraceae bacterium]|nr:energy-coupled thiamine transporter ThiT [Candidatus Limimonas coprohippi]